MISSLSTVTESESPGSVPALDRSLDILELLSDTGEGLTLSGLSKQLDVPKNAVFRITQTLLARGYLTRDSETMAFRLTSQFLKLAPPRWNGASLPELSREAMIALRDSTRETVQLGVLSGLEGTIIDQVEGLEPLRIVVDLGLRFKLHNNAPGKLLLAYLPAEEREAILSQIELPQTTSRTLTTRFELSAECERIVTQGYSIDHAEGNEGIHCIAAPVFGVDGLSVVGAIWISAPAKRLPKSRFRELGGQVKAAADQVSGLIRKLG